MSVAHPQSVDQQINMHIKDAEVLRRRIACQPYRVIAAELGISLGAAHDAFKRAMATTVAPVKEAAEEYRAMMHERYEQDLAAIEDKRLSGDLEAIRTHAVIEKAIRELHGYDAPTQITGDLTVNYRLVTDGQVDDGALT